MTRYLLDTNVVSTLAGPRRYPLLDRIEAVGRDRVYTSLVVAGEIRFGVAKKGSARLAAEMEAIFRRLEVAALHPPVDEIYGELRAGLEKRGQSIGANDLWIAAQAVSDGSIVVTDNTREFGRVPGLAVENWLRP